MRKTFVPMPVVESYMTAHATVTLFAWPDGREKIVRLGAPYRAPVASQTPSVVEDTSFPPIDVPRARLEAWGREPVVLVQRAVA